MLGCRTLGVQEVRGRITTWTALSSLSSMPSMSTLSSLSSMSSKSLSSQSSTSKPMSSTSSSPGKRRRSIEKHGPELKEFLRGVGAPASSRVHPPPPPYLDPATLRGDGLKVYMDVYGCQMNTADAEVVLGVLGEQGYSRTMAREEADVWLLLTCSIREGAEDKVWRKLHYLEAARRRGGLRPGLVVGVLGCMAERVRAGLLRQGAASIVAGPDSYRDLPRLLASQRLTGQPAINVLLSLQETYTSIPPVRLHDSVSAYVSIQRGCDNMCSYCIVPYTRGRERSRPLPSILEEVAALAARGVREVTLLGQNVNSYRDTSSTSTSTSTTSTSSSSTVPGFSTVYKPKQGGLRFVHLLDQVSAAHPDIRIRFTAPHPKDFPEELLAMIGERSNICNQLHLPAQAGSSRVLAAMGRGHTVEAYRALVARVRAAVPSIALTSDFITGFCGETEEEFQGTVRLVRDVGYSKAYMYPYSMREGTGAHRRLEDSVPQEVKAERHLRLKEVYLEGVRALHLAYHGTRQEVLVTGDSKRSKEELQGLADCGTKVIFPKSPCGPGAGDLVTVAITSSSSEVLRGELVREEG